MSKTSFAHSRMRSRMIPDEIFQQFGTIRRDPASVDTVTSSKADLSIVDRGITRASSQQTVVANQSLHGACRRRSRLWQKAKGGMYGGRQIHLVPTRTLTVSPRLQLLRPHCAYKRTLGGRFFILLLTFEMTACTFQRKMPSCCKCSCLQWLKVAL